MPSQEEMMDMIKKNHGRMSMVALMKESGCSGGQFSRQLRRLEDRGYIKINRSRNKVEVELLVDEWEHKMVI